MHYISFRVFSKLYHGSNKKFKWLSLHHDRLETGELPDAVYIRFDDETIGSNTKVTESLIAISPVSAAFYKWLWSCAMENTSINFELGCNGSQVQGSTLNKVVIGLVKRNFVKGQVYIAPSRVKTLDGIAPVSYTHLDVYKRQK